MSEIIYTREELKNLLSQNNIIRYGKGRTDIKLKNIDAVLEHQIILSTPKCRDNIRERIYWIINDMYDYHTCETCGKYWQPKFYGLGYKEFKLIRFCSAKCAAKNNLEKRSKTNLEKYGNSAYFASDVGKETIANIMLEKTGYHSPFANPEIRNKFEQERIERTGFKNPSQDPKVKLKKIQTTQLNYGVDNPMQSEEIFIRQQKSSNSYKKMIMPSGKEILYQGYEHVAINHLLNNHSEEEIISYRHSIPKIIYKNINGSSHRYYPDLYIPKQNLIIEVKSQWTFKNKSENNLLKKQTCLDLGYNFQFWICSDKEVLEII